MKTITLKKQLLLVALIFFCGVTPTFADDDTSMTLNVEAGTLSSLIPASKMYKITELKLSGELNVEDLKVIRRMGACYKSISSSEGRYDGHLQYLDLSDIKFVGEGTFTCSRLKQDFKSGYGDYIFSDMISLRRIKLPTYMTEMGRHIFDGCDNLTSLTLPSKLTSKEYNVVSALDIQNCNHLINIMIDDSNPHYSSDGYALFNKDKSKIIFVVNAVSEFSIPTSVTGFGQGAFSYCRYLKTLRLPSSLKDIDDFSFNSCVAHCGSLVSITVDENNPYYCSDGAILFDKSKSKVLFAVRTIKELSLPSSVTQIDNEAFKYCASLTSITLPSGVTRIGNYAFSNCIYNHRTTKTNQKYPSVNL